MTTMPATLTRAAARTLLLAAQGIEPPVSKPASKRTVLDAIRRMGQLQIDTISVVERSPYLVLFSRIGAFDTRWLEQLLAEGRIYEAWSHEACFLPIEAYPLTVARFGEPKPWRARNRAFLQRHRARADELIEAIRQNGPVRSADFERDGPVSGGWWNTRKHEKLLLEAMFADGMVMVVRRERFQRVYGLRESVLPAWRDEDAPSLDDADDQMIESSVKALGVVTRRWVADYYRLPVRRSMAALDRQIASHTVVPTVIDGLGEAFVHVDNVRLARRIAAGKLAPVRTVLLSPFDPIVWHRLRASELFDFDYRIECYTPAAKRVYGYFTLPILHRGNLVGRLDPKAHRARGVFEVKSLHLEPGFAPDDRFVDELAATLAEFAAWHKTPSIVIGRAEHPGLADALQARLG